jgi:hypothetical protein
MRARAVLAAAIGMIVLRARLRRNGVSSGAPPTNAAVMRPILDRFRRVWSLIQRRRTAMVEREFTCLCGNVWRESRPKFYIDDEVTCPSCGIQGVLGDGESRAVELRQAEASRREARRQRRQQEREQFATMACSVNQMQLNLQHLLDL